MLHNIDLALPKLNYLNCDIKLGSCQILNLFTFDMTRVETWRLIRTGPEPGAKWVESWYFLLNDTQVNNKVRSSQYLSLRTISVKAKTSLSRATLAVLLTPRVSDQSINSLIISQFLNLSIHTSIHHSIYESMNRSVFQWISINKSISNNLYESINSI